MDRTLAKGYQSREHTTSVSLSLFNHVLCEAHLHQRREEIAVGEIGNEASLVCPARHGNGHSDGLAT